MLARAMRIHLALALLLTAPCVAIAQPADCPALPSTGSMLPLSLDLANRPGVPPGTTGQAWIGVPMEAPRTNCGEAMPPADVLRGEPGDVLHGPRPYNR